MDVSWRVRRGTTHPNTRLVVFTGLCCHNDNLETLCSDNKEFAYNEGDPGLIPGSGRYPGEGHGNPLQYSCLENPMDGGTWQPTVHGVAKSRTRLNDFTLKLNKYEESSFS